MKSEKSKNLYILMQAFANLTKKFILQGNWQRTEKCFRIADKLLCTGNLIIRNAVANVYLYSISFVIDQLDRSSNEYRELMAILPTSLRHEYEHQVNGLGV